ncbi:TPA: hypothetical protein ACT9LC_000270 [Legionella pneumophila]|uniref:Uncharacterized protein n=1 Tax=Legionella pneumophila (strain Lens) TaxID=297245 RepID=Q5WW32_LEGPL|nr:hypothetical protein [Legionella pneumophila]AOW51798.1 hypothetical protein BE841_04700 [Legionella pneumophila subsp. pneumophila]AOW54606.1 hypothetical protein BE842_04055 [Legionella pneumophila subsp. pneumophila]AOW62592.1 hypothetical protein BE845_00275 [Legionella pneumophila subsp. pneumophila]CAH15868.1 hypothetical protein lpl1628 [Legionella pneumophila str. Lens]HAT1755171.1 hypothetical protein [Legionella pneumophila]
MFESFRKYLSAISMRAPYASTPGHRNAQRANAGSEVLGTTLETFDPAASIPTKLAQTLISIYSLFRFDTHVSEKLIHLLQGSIAATQMGLGIALLFTGTECEEYTDADLCKAIFLLQLLYRGTLLAGWAPSEFSKDPYAEPKVVSEDKAESDAESEEENEDEESRNSASV